MGVLNLKKFLTAVAAGAVFGGIAAGTASAATSFDAATAGIVVFALGWVATFVKVHFFASSE